MNRFRNASESEIREAKNKDPDSDFVYCTFPTYKGLKLLGADKYICMITVLGDSGVNLSDNVFSEGDEKKPQWSGQRKKKLPNPFSCTAPSFLKRFIKENAYNCDNSGHIIHLSCVIGPKRLMCTIRSLLFLLFK